jgi:hypothetical protein
MVDNAQKLFQGASGQANGVLGEYGFLEEEQSLATLSWKLHRDLAAKFDGRAIWGFSGMVVHELNKEDGEKGI